MTAETLENGELYPHALRKALLTATFPTVVMLPLLHLVSIGPCAGVLREGAWVVPLIGLLVAAGIAGYLASVRYFMRAYPRHQYLSPALGAALSIWNGQLMMFLAFMLLFAIGG